jgi:epoxyqueuosine reductase
MIERLRKWAESRGYRLAVGPGSLLSEARDEILERAERGELDPELVRKWLGWVRDELPAETVVFQSVIVVAIPCPAHLVRFTLPDRLLDAHVPPTYAEDARLGRSVSEQIVELLPELLGDLHPVMEARKKLAARLGLTAYGLNNITYAEGLGSFVWLGAYATRAALGPFPPLATGFPRTLEECSSCGICRDVCPTGAIAEERFLLRAERCLTFYNELQGSWPGWLPASAHNCLVGCLICQEVCPRNRGLLETRDSGVLFDAEETAAMVTGRLERDPAIHRAVLAKLAEVGIADYVKVIGRNVAALSGGAG